LGDHDNVKEELHMAGSEEVVKVLHYIARMTRRETGKDKNEINWGKDEAQIYQDKTKTSKSSCKSVLHGREWHTVIHGREKNENPDQTANQKQADVQRGWKEQGSGYSTNSDSVDLREIMEKKRERER
jgi:hypothetical protein